MKPNQDEFRRVADYIESDAHPGLNDYDALIDAVDRIRAYEKTQAANSPKPLREHKRLQHEAENGEERDAIIELLHRKAFYATPEEANLFSLAAKLIGKSPLPVRVMMRKRGGIDEWEVNHRESTVQEARDWINELSSQMKQAFEYAVEYSDDSGALVTERY
jgi:hypothetical protein